VLKGRWNSAPCGGVSGHYCLRGEVAGSHSDFDLGALPSPPSLAHPMWVCQCAAWCGSEAFPRSGVGFTREAQVLRLLFVLTMLC